MLSTPQFKSSVPPQNQMMKNNPATAQMKSMSLPTQKFQMSPMSPSRLPGQFNGNKMNYSMPGLGL